MCQKTSGENSVTRHKSNKQHPKYSFKGRLSGIQLHWEGRAVLVPYNVFLIFLCLLLLFMLSLSHVHDWSRNRSWAQRIISDLYTLYPPSLPGYKYNDSVMISRSGFENITSSLKTESQKRREERLAERAVKGTDLRAEDRRGKKKQQRQEERRDKQGHRRGT